MNEVIQQVRKVWGELGINQRVSIVLAMGVVVIGMAALLVWTGRPQMQLLYGKLDAKEMAQVMTLIEEQAVPYRIGPGGGSIFVPRDQVYRLRMEFAANGIPNGGGVGFEIFDRGNFGISDFVQRTNYLRALQGKLARTVAQLQGVRSARVMVVVPENKLLVTNAKGGATASVFVDTGGGQLAIEAVNSIRFLVANAVEGLLLDDVAVVDNHGHVLSEDLQKDEIVGVASGQFRFKKSLEDHYAEKIETMLNRVVGVGNSVARVSVEVETQASTVVEERFDPESQVVRSETLTEQTTTSNESRPTQPVGVSSNTSDDSELTGRTGENNVNSSEERVKNKTIAYEINRSTLEIIKSPGTVKRISAAVFVALRFKQEDGIQAADPRSPEELQKLRAVVINALGVESPRDSGPDQNITLEEIAFAPVEGPLSTGFFDIQSNLYEWFDIVRNFAAVGVAVVMFVIFLRMLKRHRPDSLSVEVVDENGSPALPSATNMTPQLTPELLTELISEKPENVSTALKTWVTGPKSS